MFHRVADIRGFKVMRVGADCARDSKHRVRAVFTARGRWAPLLPLLVNVRGHRRRIEEVLEFFEQEHYQHLPRDALPYGSRRSCASGATTLGAATDCGSRWSRSSTTCRLWPTWRIGSAFSNRARRS